MKIKRYIDKDMRQVLRQVRADQGPDAVILSNRRVDDGIEVITAVDYDEALVQSALGSQLDAMTDARALAGMQAAEGLESLAAVESSDSVAAGDDSRDDVHKIVHANLQQSPPELVSAPDINEIQKPGDDAIIARMHSEMSSMRSLLETQLSGLVWKDKSRKAPMRAQILRNLSQIGIAPDIAQMIANRTPPIDDHKLLWRAPLTTLAQTIPTIEDKLLDEGGVAALIGPTGVGKTTTIAKMAVRFAMTHGSDQIALICADAYRIGAREHLSAFANIIGVRVHAASSSGELAQVLQQVADKKLVLIDTEGFSQRDKDLAAKLAAYGDHSDRVRFYLTLSAASQESSLDEALRQFNKVPLSGAIVTKVDEAGQLGCAISALIRNDLPFAYLSDGQRVPDDLYTAQKKKLWLVNQAVECAQAVETRIDERIMAENYSELGVVNA